MTHTLRVILLTLSAALEFSAALIYCASIIRGRTKPHRITRLVLMFILVLGFTSILSAKNNLGAIIYAGIACGFGIAYFGLSLRRGLGGSDVFDWLCFIIAMAGIIGWQTTGNAVLGIWLASLADFVAYLPAFVKTWKQPRTETPWLYSLGVISGLMSLAAYPLATVSIFQITLVLTGVLMLICIYHKRIFSSVGSLNS